MDPGTGGDPVALFTIAKYDYPSADDWSFGKYMYRAMQAGEGIAGVFHAIYQTLAQNVWEARFSILILRLCSLRHLENIFTGSPPI